MLLRVSALVKSDSLKESCENLDNEVPAFGNYIVDGIGNQCSTHLKLVSDIPRLYRRTNREVIAYYFIFTLYSVKLK